VSDAKNAPCFHFLECLAIAVTHTACTHKHRLLKLGLGAHATQHRTTLRTREYGAAMVLSVRMCARDDSGDAQKASGEGVEREQREDGGGDSEERKKT
jgi:hypothetical protein